MALSALAVLQPTAVWAQAWRLLATTTVRLVDDVDVVPVTFLQGTFTHLQLRVRGNGIYMNSLRVTFSNGQTTNLPVRAFIPAGGQTRQIDLPGNRRFIRYVQLNYRSQPNARAAPPSRSGPASSPRSFARRRSPIPVGRWPPEVSLPNGSAGSPGLCGRA